MHIKRFFSSMEHKNAKRSVLNYRHRIFVGLKTVELWIIVELHCEFFLGMKWKLVFYLRKSLICYYNNVVESGRMYIN